MLAGLHERGFTDLVAAHLDVWQYPGPEKPAPPEARDPDAHDQTGAQLPAGPAPAARIPDPRNRPRATNAPSASASPPEDMPQSKQSAKPSKTSRPNGNNNSDRESSRSYADLLTQLYARWPPRRPTGPRRRAICTSGQSPAGTPPLGRSPEDSKRLAPAPEKQELENQPTPARIRKHGARLNPIQVAQFATSRRIPYAAAARLRRTGSMRRRGTRNAAVCVWRNGRRCLGGDDQRADDDRAAGLEATRKHQPGADRRKPT